MKKLIVLVVLLLILSSVVVAQVAPPVGYLDSCQANPVMYEYFGSRCLNPVLWDDVSIIPWQDINIGDFVSFVGLDGVSDFGVMQGYWWDFVESRYKYYVMVAPPHSGIDAAFVDVAPERIIP